MRAAAEIQDVERISREALAQVRAAVRGYRATGLRAEVDEARAALRAAGIEFNCDMPDARLAPSQESALAFAVREAVTNILRHSGARSCRLALRFDSGVCEMAIDDDGRGGSAAEGCGLSGMRERVQALGGTLERAGSHGTSLRIRLPLHAASGAA